MGRPTDWRVLSTVGGVPHEAGGMLACSRVADRPPHHAADGRSGASTEILRNARRESPSESHRRALSPA